MSLARISCCGSVELRPPGSFTPARHQAAKVAPDGIVAAGLSARSSYTYIDYVCMIRALFTSTCHTRLLYSSLLYHAPKNGKWEGWEGTTTVPRWG